MDRICKQRGSFRENKKKNVTCTQNRKERVYLSGIYEQRELGEFNTHTGYIESKNDRGKQRVT